MKSTYNLKSDLAGIICQYVKEKRQTGFKFERQGKLVWLWPLAHRDGAPLALRLIRLKGKTKCKGSRRRQDVYLLSNVFDEKQLSRSAAAEIYRRRWGVEVFYRSFKQTLDQRKLRSRAPGPAQQELHWALTSLLLLGLMSVQGMVQKNIAPFRLSVGGALRVVRRAMSSFSVWRYSGDLRMCLCKCLRDSYQRKVSKRSRDWPHKKQELPPGAPKIRRAKPEEISCAQRIYHVA